MSVMTILLALEDAGLGALFFGVFKGERQLRQTLGIPPWMQLLGAIAAGYPADPTDARGTTTKGRSATRPRRSSSEIIHQGHW